MIDALYEFGVPFVVGADVSDEMLAYALADTSRRRRLELLDVESVTGGLADFGQTEAAGAVTISGDRTTAALVMDLFAPSAAEAG